MADSSGMRAGLKGNVEEALRLFASESEWAGLNLAETEFVLEEALKGRTRGQAVPWDEA